MVLNWHAEMMLMSKSRFAVVPPALCPHKFFYVAAEGVGDLVGRRGII